MGIAKLQVMSGSGVAPEFRLDQERATITMTAHENWAARLMHQETFTPAELAELLNMSEAFIAQEVHKGELEGLKIGNDIVDIPRDSVLAWMKRREEASE